MPSKSGSQSGSQSAAQSAGLIEPTVPVSRRWLLLFASSWFGFWLLVSLPGQIMVAQLAQHLDPARKEELLSLFTTLLMLTMVVAVPIAGYLCDRTRSRFGRRRVWTLGGFAVAGAAFVPVGYLDSVPLICVLLVLVSLGVAAAMVALSARIADQVPVPQRGRASAAYGVPQVVALAGGMVVVTMVVTDVGPAWALIGVIAFCAAVPFVLVEADSPVSEPVKGGLAALRPPGLGATDYYWALAARVLVNAGNLIGTTYLLFYLQDVLARPDPDTSLLTLTLAYLVFCVVATWGAGVVSDRSGRRKPLIVIGGGLQAAAALTLAVAPGWSAALIAAALLGLGYGAFLSVDQALTTDVLPDAEHRARDLGLINAAQQLPIAPLIGWLVLSASGNEYRVLYLASALVTCLGVLAVLRVRGVR